MLSHIGIKGNFIQDLLFRKEIQKHKEELEEKKKEVELLEQKINELEQTFY